VSYSASLDSDVSLSPPSVVLTPINTYGPSVIKSLGYTGYTAVSIILSQCLNHD
jgi:hypothetical protein